jgi:uncharacterized membrane protein YbhN (UPF0104 family)
LLGLVAFLNIFPPTMQRPILVATIGFAALIIIMTPGLMARRPRDWLLTRLLRLAPRRVRPAIERWRDQFGSLDLRPALLMNLILATLISATSTMVRLWLLFQAMEITAIPLLALLATMALIAILQALPISFSGVGVRDAILIALLVHYGYTKDQALSLSLLFLLVNLEHILVGFLVSLRYPLGQAPRAGELRIADRGSKIEDRG